MGAEQLMHGLVGGDKGEPIGQLKALLRQCAPVAQAGGAQRRLVDQLKSESRLDTSAILLAPATEQVPGPQAQMLWGQQPKADQIAIDLVGQQLTDTAFEADGISGFALGAFLGTLGFDSRFRVGTIAMEFFFEGQTVL